MIANKAPFFQKGYNLSLNEAPMVVAQTTEFAEKRGIKLLVSRQHFRDGEFSTTLVTKDMNIILITGEWATMFWLAAIARAVLRTKTGRCFTIRTLHWLGPLDGERPPARLLCGIGCCPPSYDIDAVGDYPAL